MSLEVRVFTKAFRRFACNFVPRSLERERPRLAQAQTATLANWFQEDSQLGHLVPHRALATRLARVSPQETQGL
jgi:hypothetical protein